LALLAIVMMTSQRLLARAQTRALEASLENIELQDAQAALQQKTEELETTTAQLTARSAELEEANQRQAKINRQLEETARMSQRRAALLRTSAEVSRTVAQIRDLNLLLPQVTQLISQRFGFYHVGIFLIEELPEGRRSAVLRAANSEGGRRMLARKHHLDVGSQGIVGYVTGTGRPRIALDVGTDAIFFDNPDLPDTRSEMAAPLRIGEDIIGALDIQSTREDAFDQEDVAMLGFLADQIAIAIENARLFRQSQDAIEEAQETYRRYLRQEWDSFLGRRRSKTPSNLAVGGTIND
jgi:transcriptional regulator with GAF, ATPase, and Fis domain